MIKANKGEWSELYAFLKILIDRKIFAADADLNIIPDKHFEVLKIIRQESSVDKTYDVSVPEKITISVGSEGVSEFVVVDPLKLKKKVRAFFDEIKNSSGRSFGVSMAIELMEELKCIKVKAKNKNKADIILIIHDRIASTYPELGFSIKSRIGKPATLLNASGATNFIFKLVVTKKARESKSQKLKDGMSTIADRLEDIEYGSDLCFFGMQNETFEANLRRIDTVLPEILAEIIKTYYRKPVRSLVELIDKLDEIESLKSEYGLGKADYVYKIKKFLVAIALGMTPAKKWDGLTVAHGGYIIVKEDGEVVCYHLYNRDEFEEYLFKNSRLETGSPSRHRFGQSYEEKGENYLKLNLQIRFIK